MKRILISVFIGVLIGQLSVALYLKVFISEPVGSSAPVTKVAPIYPDGGKVTLSTLFELYLFIQSEQNGDSVRINMLQIDEARLNKVEKKLKALDIHVKTLSEVCGR